MDIENVHYKLRDDNIFTLRKKDYEKIEDECREILRPAEEIGFTVKEYGFKNARIFTGELSPTLRKNLKILLERNNNEVDLSFSVPKLIDNNYVFINGRKKIPFFQLFDLWCIFCFSWLFVPLSISTIYTVTPMHLSWY